MKNLLCCALGALSLALASGCSKESGESPAGSGASAVSSGGSDATTGGSVGTGGSPMVATGGVPSGDSGGAASSGASSSGGAASGGAPTGGGASSGGAPGSATGGAGAGGTPGAGGGNDGTGGVVQASACEQSLGVRLVGRFACDGPSAQLAWSGAGFVARLEGSGLTLTLRGRPAIYSVIVDGTVSAELTTQEGEQAYEVVSGLAAGEHTVELYRQGEPSWGTSTVLQVAAIDGQLMDPPARPARRIEIFGDSISCGYGNEGTSADCDFTAETQNHYLTYGALLARHFQAELSTVAWSGRGVVVNYAGEQGTTLPQMMHRADANSEQSVWDYSLAPEPQLVLINLGTNDFSTDNDPDVSTFTSTYVKFLSDIRAKYPAAHILCTNGPLLYGDDLVKVRQGIAAAVQTLNDRGDAKVHVHELAPNNPNPGCHSHPSLATHAAMAEELKTPVSTLLGW